MNELSNKFLVGIQTIEFLIEKLNLAGYFENPEITEIMINGDNKIYLEKANVGKVYAGHDSNQNDLLNLIQVVGSMENKEINYFNPDIRTNIIYKNMKCRFTGAIPPVTNEPTCTIRKKSTRIIPLESYVSSGFMSEDIKDLLIDYLKERKNILVVGATNTGKTTFLNALLNQEIVKSERLFVIEDVQEIQATSENINYVQVHPWYDPKRALSLAVRYTPERIIYGEVIGGEAFDMLNTFNTGHGGGITTIHANDCYSALDKLETFVLYTQPFPMSQLIARVIDVVIVLSIEKATRFLHSIAEVKGYENGKYILDFKYKNYRVKN